MHLPALLVVLAALALVDARSHEFARLRRHTTSLKSHNSTTRHHATHRNSTHKSESHGSCKVSLAAAEVERWEKVTAKTLSECAKKVAQSKSSLAVCHSTAYVDEKAKTYGGAVHVFQIGGHQKNSTDTHKKGKNSTHTEHKEEHKHTKRSTGSYSVLLSTTSGDLIESASFRLAELHAKCNPCSSDNITRPSFEVGHLSLLASLHYNAAFDSKADLAPSAVVVADKGAHSGGHAELVHLGALASDEKPWGLFLGMPAATKLHKRAAYGEESSAGKTCSAKTRSAKTSTSDKADKSDKSSKSDKSAKSAKTDKSRAKKPAVEARMTDDTTCRVTTEGKKSTSKKAPSSKQASASSVAKAAASTPAQAAAPVATGSVANAAAAAPAAATPAAAAASPAAANADAATAAADTATDPTTSDAPQSLQVVPIGIGVGAGASLVSVLIVGVVMYERRKYRRNQRSTVLAQQIQQSTTGYGTREVPRVRV